MEGISNNCTCVLSITPRIPEDANELLLLLRDLAAETPGIEIQALAETLIPPKGENAIVEDYYTSHFGERIDHEDKE